MGTVPTFERPAAGLWDRVALRSDVRLSRPDRRRARQNAVFLLLIAIAGSIVAQSYLRDIGSSPARIWPDLAAVIAAFLALIAMFLVNRRGHVTIAGVGAVLLITAVIYWSAISGEAGSLSYLSVPIVVTGVLFGPVLAAVLTLLASSALALYPVVTGMPLPVTALSFLILTGAAVVFAGAARRQVDQDRQELVDEHQSELDHMATHDELTGLPNRRLFEDRLSHALDRLDRGAGSVAVMLLDLDNFKQVNDALAHTGGDLVLTAIAERLTTVVRQTDTVARRGGDSYSLLLEDLQEPEASRRVVMALLDAIRAPLTVDGRSLVVTASIGVAVAPGDGTETEELISRADTALYAAKAAGRASFAYYSEKMRRSTMDRLALAHDLGNALKRRELIPAFQKQHDARHGTVIGAESLLRWRHPARGLVPPGQFIPVAEETGVITDITDYVITDAFERLSRHSIPKIAVNIAARDLLTGTLSDRITALAREYGVDPSCLEVELTENILYGDIPEVEATLRRLHDHGVRVAIDDFGTGYATIRQLARLPIDTIKIDRSVTQDLSSGGRGDAAVAGIIEIARRLDIAVIAEGVETAEQVERYQALGCHLFQGWHFSQATAWEDLRVAVDTGRTATEPEL